MSGSSDPSRFVTEAVLAGRMPGAAWRVEQGGRLLGCGFSGVACQVPGAEPLLETTPWDLASLTKPLVTAPLLLISARRGLLNLDDPAGRWLPRLAGSPWAERSLFRLATHTSGLPAWAPLYTSGSTRDAYVDSIASIAGLPAGPERYSDLGYVLLGFAIEAAWGEPLDELFLRLLAGPSGVTRSGFARDGVGFEDAAATEVGNDYEKGLAGERGHGYGFREAPIRGAVHDGNAFALGGVAGHAGLFGTAADVARLAAWLAGPGGPLEPVELRAWIRVPGPGATRTVGLVTAAGSEAARGALPDDAPGHTGFTGTSVWIEPDRGRVHVLLANRVHPRVPGDSFQPVRNRFHRLARGLPD